MKMRPNQHSQPERPEHGDSITSGDLFPETIPPVLPAVFPTVGSRADEALQALLGGPQNQADYWKSWRLAAAVDTLKNLGWPIVRRDIQRPGCRTPIREYAIDMQHPAFIGAMRSRQKGVIDANLLGILMMAAISAACFIHLMAVV